MQNDRVTDEELALVAADVDLPGVVARELQAVRKAAREPVAWIARHESKESYQFVAADGWKVVPVLNDTHPAPPDAEASDGVMVPSDASDEMLLHAWLQCGQTIDTDYLLRRAYRSMIKAAPTAPPRAK